MLGHKKDLGIEDKWQIIAQMMFYCDPKSNTLNADPFAMQKVADLLNVSVSSVSRIWTQYLHYISNGIQWPKLESPRTRQCGRKSKLNVSIPEDILHEMNKRLKYSAPIRDQVLELFDTTGYKISKSSLHRYLRKNLSYAYGCGYIKPLLSEVNKRKRVKFILNKVERLFEDNGKRPTDVYRYMKLNLAR